MKRAAGLLLAWIAFAALCQGQITVNIVGYVNVTVTPGHNFPSGRGVGKADRDGLLARRWPGPGPAGVGLKKVE